MNIIKSQLVKLLGTSFAVLVLSVPAYCQSGPPAPPADPTLSTYYFEGSPWYSWDGDLPLNYSTNLVSFPLWNRNALLLDTTNESPTYLNYCIIQTNDGSSNLDFSTGALKFSFISDWATADTNQCGTGPTDWAFLIAAGDFSSGSPDGLWAVYIDPGGTNIYFGGVSNSVSTVFISAPISWPANSIHLVGIEYTSTNSTMYLDGQLAATGNPVTIVPATNVWTNGFFVGSDASGYEQAQGLFLSMEFYDSNFFDPDWSDIFGDPYLTNGWLNLSNNFSTWLAAQGGGFSFESSDGFSLPPDPTNTVNTNYAAYTNFWLTVSNVSTNVNIRVVNTLSNVTYEVLTNSSLASTNWGVWQTFLASNSITLMPSIGLSSNTLFFRGVIVGSTGTNGLPDYWCLEYFGTLNVDPYADPDSDGLCNMDEYLLGTNPTNAHSISSTHTDAQALFLGYTNDSACHYHISVTNGSGTNTVLVTMSPTMVGTNYQIYTHQVSDTNNTWIVETNFLGTNTSTTVAITLNGRTLNYIGGYGEDSDGDGLPDGYEVLATLTDPYLPDTGMSGVADGYKDPDGDGYSNLEEMYNGTNPHVFNTPAGSLALGADFTNGGSNLSIFWQPAPGPVLGYVIYAQDPITDGWDAVATNSASLLTYIIDNITNYGYDSSSFGWFGIQAVYAGGSSTINQGGMINYPAVAGIALANGPGGKEYLLSSAASTNITGYTNFIWMQYSWSYPEYAQYSQPYNIFPPGSGEIVTNAYIPKSQFTNGIAVLTETQAPTYAQTWLYGPPYESGYAQIPGGGRCNLEDYAVNYAAVPFVDGSTQMKQNVRFLLRADGFASFGYDISGNTFSYPTNYVYSGCYYVSSPSFYPTAYLDHFAPFQDNYFFRNFAFDSTSITTNGTYNTGFDPGGYDYYKIASPKFEFPTYSYVTSSNGASVPGILASNIPWVGFINSEYESDFGVFHSGGAWGMSNYANIYGLPYESLDTVYLNNIHTLTPGSTLPSFGNFFAGTAQPELQTVDYYFGRPGTDPLPGYQDGSFDVTNTTPPLILTSVGSSLLIAGYAKQAVLNGSTNVFAYLGQYFTNAFLMTNGVLTTNSAGILSEYGEFFSTLPGHVGLVTMPDPDQTNIQGVCEIDSIRLSLDVNHDGVMDESYTGPDNSSIWTGVAYNFWVNNDYDRWTGDILDSAPYQDDIQTAAQPDCNYMTNGNRAIPSTRDLEDYARLWVSGVSNTLSRLPTGSTVTLSWAGYYNSPTIDLFQAADADGGIGYLTNLTTASNQINNTLCQYVGRLGPGSNMVLNASTFSNGWAGDHYIWCGVAAGNDELDLTVSDGSGNVLAKSAQYIQIRDIKNMYERWTVGETPTDAPWTNAAIVDDGQPTGGQARFAYTYDPAINTNDTYIVYVHGWNEPTWEKDRWAETAYKRLYWQGYQGRFGEFRWPCYMFNLGNLSLYDMSESNAWSAGQSLETFLARLNGMYPSNVYLLAHSQGNVVAGEALRLATNQIVNTYVATQAALSARAYDNTVPADATNYYGINGSFLRTPDSEGYYYTNGAPSYFNGSSGAGKYVNFYNPLDWALMGTVLGWIKDQSAKPDGYAGYFYTTPSFSIPYGYYQQNAGIDHATRSNWPENALLFPGDTYPIFAMCAQSYSLALGAQTNVNGSFNTNAQINLNTSFGFGSTHIYHDGQFVSDNMTMSAYWKQLFQSFGLQN